MATLDHLSFESGEELNNEDFVNGQNVIFEAAGSGKSFDVTIQNRTQGKRA